MSLPKRTLLMLAVLLGLVALWASSAQAKSRNRGLRAEVAALKARIAQVESTLEFQMRRDSQPIGLLPMAGMCEDPCAEDSDDDGTGDCEDPCPCDAGNADGDADGTPDCMDPCPDDATDACIDPCHMDSDGDGVSDCEDPCPWDPAPAEDHDGDDVADCMDPCPDDKSNDCYPHCATDVDGDGSNDCNDPCPWGEDTGRPCILNAPGGATGT